MTAAVATIREGADHLGASLQPDGRCDFRVWAPYHDRLRVKLHGHGPPREMDRDGDGYHTLSVDGVRPDQRYLYVLPDGTERPDPASRSQPEGVHGPSAVLDPNFDWTDGDFESPPLADQVLYELHVGTFTEDGTFDAVIDRLEDLRSLGVTTLQVMPVAQFPGTRNWGYDGVGLFAAQHSYGGAPALKRLVDASHARGMSVLLDVVYNHLGPEGNYLRDFGPYFTDHYRTPWGDALNFDGPDSDHVRVFFIRNALYWIEDCHVDGLRLDAVHAIVDNSPLPFIEQLAGAVHDRAEQLGRRVHVIAESAANDSRLLRPPSRGGFGMDAQWNDDFHHVVHTLLTGEDTGYYESYDPSSHLQRLFDDGFAYTGEYSPFHRRRHGRPSADVPFDRFIVFSQNHDQVGNRRLGERLSTLAGRDAARLAAALTLLSPFVPMLFMGEEYAEPAPFLYFVDHGDERLLQAVRDGRRAELEAFRWQGEPPDPADPGTFRRSVLDWSLRRSDGHAQMLRLYRDLIRLRREHAALHRARRDTVTAHHDRDAATLTLVYRDPGGHPLAVIANLAGDTQEVSPRLPPGHWALQLDSADLKHGGSGSTAPPRMDLPGATVPLQPYATAVYRQGA